MVSAAATHRYILLAASLVLYAAVFASFVLFELPGLGLAHFFYLAIAMTALATGPAVGAAAGVGAAMLYAAGVLLNPHIPPTEVVTASTGIRLATFTAIGCLVGWFAARNRSLVERLRILADRDVLTGLPNSRAFEAAFARRLDTNRPFAILVGDLHALHQLNGVSSEVLGDETLHRLGDLLRATLDRDDEVARIGDDEFAILTSAAEDGNILCTRLEAMLAAHGVAISFGWARYPSDGADALSLFRVADERLYVRKFVRNSAAGSPAAV